MNVFNAGSDIINWDVNQRADISSEVYNVYENSRVMILTIGNIETYTSYLSALRNFLLLSILYVCDFNTGNTTSSDRTIITSTHIHTKQTTITITTTLLGQVTATTTINTDITYTIPTPTIITIVTSSGPTTIGGTTIIHTSTTTTITKTVTVTVIVPEV